MLQMIMPVECSDCGKRYNVAADLAGQQIVCRHCGKPFFAEPLPASEAIADRASLQRANGRQIVLFGLMGIVFLAGICIFLAVHTRQQIRAERQEALARLAAENATRTGPAPSARNRPRPASEKPVAEISAHDLWQAFGKNGMAADMAYRNKVILVRGTISKIQADKQQHYFIGLNALEPTANSSPKAATVSPPEKRWSRDGYPANVICFLNPARHVEFKRLESGNRVTIIGRCIGLKQDRDVYKGYVVTLEDCTLVKHAETHRRAAR